MRQVRGEDMALSAGIDGIPQRCRCPECGGEATRVFGARIGYHLSCATCGCEFYDEGNVVRHGSEHPVQGEKTR